MVAFRAADAEFTAVLTALRLTSLEATFNELLGYTAPITPATNEVFEKFANIYAEYLNIGPCGETGVLTNLDAIIPYALVLPELPYYEQVERQLKSLTYIRNTHILVPAIAQFSLILDEYGKSHNFVELFDNLYPLRTKSSYTISNLLGDYKLIPTVKDGVQCLVDSLDESEVRKLFVVALDERALDQYFGKNYLSSLYTDTDCELCYNELESNSSVSF